MGKAKSCFKNSFDCLMRFTRDWRLCHGVPTLQVGKHAGKRYGHAWIEFGDKVYDPTVNISIDKKSYYAIGKINEAEVVRYTREEALKNAEQTLHYGPWSKSLLGGGILYDEDN